MASPTPVTKTEWKDGKGLLYWSAEFTVGLPDNFTDQVIIDISALSPPPEAIKVVSIQGTISGDVVVTLEYDATTDEEIYKFAGQTDVSHPVVMDFSVSPFKGVRPTESAAGFVGDVLLTTTGAAASDEVALYIEFKKAGDV